MDLPREIPVMTLPNVILFPKAMLPLYIFEPRYRQMLRDTLNSHRMFSVALQKPGRVREIPSTVAGLGLIRVSVSNKDGTSHLILQGLTRVALAETVQYKPYRVQKIHPIETEAEDSVAVDALSAKVLELVAERVEHGCHIPVHFFEQVGGCLDAEPNELGSKSLKHLAKHLVTINDPDRLADLVSCTLLSGPVERQTILETPHLETRLKYLIHFLMAENNQCKKK
jgi:ATP-dependent Lon protease